MSFQTFRVYLFAVLAMLFWGLAFVWFKIVVKWYEPVTIIFLRLVISGIILISYLLLTRSWQKIKRKHLKYFFLLSFTQPFCYFLGESFGLKLVSPTIAAVIIATIPLFSPIAAHYMVRERITFPVLAGLVFSFFGILLLLFNTDRSFNAVPLGVLFLFGAVVSAVIYSVIIRKIPNEYSPVTIITVQNLIGALYFLPIFLIFDFKHFITVIPNRELITALLQLAVFGSSLAYIFYVTAIQGIGVIRTNTFANLIPVITGIFSFFTLGERFTELKIIGMVLVMLGVIIAQSRKIGRISFKSYPKRIEPDGT
jgi:drug/metabolite transporter (DMT)-like permease